MKKNKFNIALTSVIFLFYFFISGCSGCSESGLRNRRLQNNAKSNINNSNPVERNNGKTTIKMKKDNGVYQIPVEINGVLLYFIFDTGASSISISQTEANLLYKQGTLTESDIKGTQNFIDATGAISEGTVINLKEVKIGDRVLKNIEASIVNNFEAPLLLGQSVLAKFGKVSIDYQNNEITFE